MDRKRFLLVGGLMLFGAVAFFSLIGEKPPENAEVGRRAASNGPDVAAAPLPDAPASMRKLGIARANFLGLKAPERPHRDLEDLSFKERRLLEKFRDGKLGHIANSTVFTAPGAEKPLERNRKGAK